MKLNPEILSQHREDNLVTLELRVPEDLFYFEGHFPKTPILPGITQLHWAIELIKQTFDEPQLSFERVEVLKFQVITVPGQQVQLTLERHATKTNQFKFGYTSAKGSHSSGRIILG